MKKQVLDMYTFNVWANKTMFNRLKEISQFDYTKEIPSVFPSISKVMPHIYMVEYTWYEIMAGKSMNEAMTIARQLQEHLETRSIAELEIMFNELSVQIQILLEQIENMDKTIILDNPYAGVRETSYSEMVLQVVNHGTYHRGNITAMLRQIGHASVMTEYALYWYAQ